MKPRDLKPGDVVQISPTAENRLAGLLAFVEEPKSWGMQGWVGWPEPSANVVCLVGTPCRAYVRVVWADMEYIGPAAWVPES